MFHTSSKIYVFTFVVFRRKTYKGVRPKWNETKQQLNRARRSLVSRTHTHTQTIQFQFFGIVCRRAHMDFVCIFIALYALECVDFFLLPLLRSNEARRKNNENFNSNLFLFESTRTSPRLLESFVVFLVESA